MTTTPDFEISNHGSIFLFTPLTEAALDWWGENVADDAQRLGRSYAVEHRYAENIAAGIADDGLTVS